MKTLLTAAAVLLCLLASAQVEKTATSSGSRLVITRGDYLSFTKLEQTGNWIAVRQAGGRREETLVKRIIEHGDIVYSCRSYHKPNEFPQAIGSFNPRSGYIYNNKSQVLAVIRANGLVTTLDNKKTFVQMPDADNELIAFYMLYYYFPSKGAPH